MHKTSWDDLRYVLAVADGGSVSEAARALGVNHATVLRRIAAFEEAAGAPVFERSSQGYRLRPDRLMVIEAAREAAEALDKAGRYLRETLPDGGTLLRLTSVDSLCQTVLAEGLGKISRRVAPHRVHLLAANTHLDIARMQADMTVRPTDELDPALQGEQAGHLGLAVYARPGAPDQWLGLTGTLSNATPGRWMAENVLQDQVAAAADSFVILRSLASAGMGRVILPCVLGERAPDLERVAGDMPQFSVPLWVATHRDLAGISRIETLRHAIVSVLRGRADELAGQTR